MPTTPLSQRAPLPGHPEEARGERLPLPAGLRALPPPAPARAAGPDPGLTRPEAKPAVGRRRVTCYAVVMLAALPDSATLAFLLFGALAAGDRKSTRLNSSH